MTDPGATTTLTEAGPARRVSWLVLDDHFVGSSLQSLITAGESRPNRLGHPLIDTAAEIRTGREIPR
jgi:hypothetical protein